MSALSGPARVVVVFALVAGLASTVWGVAQLPWPRCVPFTPWGLATFSGYLLVASAAVYILARLLRIRVWVAATAVCLFLGAAAGAAGSMLWVAACGLSFLVVGGAIADAIGCTSDRTTRWLLHLALGSIAYGSLLEAVSGLPIHGDPLYLAIVVAPVAIWRSRSGELIATVASAWRAPDRSGSATSLTAAGTAGIASLYVIISLLPETAYDALVFHLAVPFEYAIRGQWHFDTGQMLLSMLPKHTQSIYALGFLQGGEAGARLMNAGFLLCTGFQIYSITERYAPRYTGVCATLALALFLSMPLSFTVGASLFVEPLWALYTVTAIGVILRCREDNSVGGWIIPVGLLLAGSVATKPQALLTSTAITALMLPALIRELPKLPYGRLLAWAIVIVAVSAQPYVRSWILSGNPVFPFFNQHFRAASYPAEAFVDARWLSTVSWSILYDLQFHSQRFIEGVSGVAGFQWLALLPACVAAAALSRNRTSLLLLASAVLMCASIFIFVRYLRYVFPAFCVCAPLIGIGVASLGPVLSRAAIGLGALCVAANLLFLPAASHYHRGMPLTATFSGAARERYLGEQAPVRLAVSAVNVLNAAARPVAFLCEPFGAGSEGLPLYDEWYNRSFHSSLAQSSSADLVEVLCGRGVDYVILADSWRTEARRQAVESITDGILRIGSVQVRRVREANCLSAEVLRNTRFQDEADTSWAWAVAVGHDCHPDGGVLVTASAHGHQSVPAEPGTGYVLTVSAYGSSAGSASRAQVVWLDREQRPIRVDIEPFSAARSGSSHTMRGTVPEGAVSGRVYATGHTDDSPVCITCVSLRWRP